MFAPGARAMLVAEGSGSLGGGGFLTGPSSSFAAAVVFRELVYNHPRFTGGKRL